MSVAPQHELDAFSTGLGEMIRLAEAALEHTTASRPAFPTEVSLVLRKMAETCLDAVARAAEAMAFPCGEVERDRQAKIAELRRELYRDLISGGNAIGVASACEASLAARYYELSVAHAAAVIEHSPLLTGYPAPG